MTDLSPGVSLGFIHGQATDRGLRRTLNEDSLLASERLLAIADGMGGHEAGDIASALCLKILGDGFQQAGAHLDPQSLDTLLIEADRSIVEAGSGRAGTTLTGALLIDASSIEDEPVEQPQLLVFNVGDSRTYLWAQGILQQVSVDHSEVQELMDIGQLDAAQAATHPRRHVITRALGINADNRPDYWMVPLSGCERILVCSDGLSSEIGDSAIQEVLAHFPDPQQAAEELVQAALDSGGRDNISVIVADVQYGHPDDVGITVPRITTTSHQEEKS
ncbi:PP2C family protein-serine/threonine phosphatase [Glutamicibacter arilaitensis]|uniref:PP2C family protein-serine/threonine phosphatase n=1 Tax=Glutamicibacter arilaitensis TaxID=256701 RepID=UPI003F8E00AD